MGESGREVEAKLVVCSAHPREVAAEVAALAALGRFRLVERGVVRLRDVYLDTPGGALARVGVSLRVRSADGERLLTFKGPAERDREAGVVTRDEVELSWSGEALERVLAGLSGWGVRLPPAPADAEALGPWEALRALGLVVVQDRATERRVRDVAEGEESAPLAELVVDSVRYEVGGRGVWHHEVEVESRPAGGPGVVREVAGALRSRFPDVLRPWTRGKLSTGRALERLAGEGRLWGVVDGEGSLEPEAYTLLQER